MANQYCVFCSMLIMKEGEIVCDECNAMDWTEEKEKWNDEYVPPTKRKASRTMRRLIRITKKSKIRLAFHQVKLWKKILSYR